MTTAMIDTTGIKVPIIRARFGPHFPVQGYVTGSRDVKWTTEDFAFFNHKMRTCQSASLSENIASSAREIDVEPLAATAAMVPPFLDSRVNKKTMQVYSDLSGVPDIISECERTQTPVRFRWRLAWYWGKSTPPSAKQVLAELHSLTGVSLDPSTLWACQWLNAPDWDINIIYGDQDFDQ